MKKFLSASVMCADLMDMQKSVAELEKAGIDYLHVDLMDGDFVPNITLGFDFVNQLKRITDIPLDVHMMVSNPARFIDRMNLSEDDIICVHYEADRNVRDTLTQIRQKGCKAGLAINPLTDANLYREFADTIDMALVMTVPPGFAGQKIFEGAEQKVTQTRRIFEEEGYPEMLIEVDGNITLENGRKLSRCGADIFVLGTSGLFINGKDMSQSASEFRAVL